MKCWDHFHCRAKAAMLGCIGLFGLAQAGPAFAQATGPSFPQQSPLQHIAPQPAPPLGGNLPNFRPQTSESTLPNDLIAVRSVSIIGATAFPAAQLNAITAGLAGQAVALPKLEATRRALVNLYRGHGFILTTVSMDIDAGGNVHYVVAEGHIVAVKLSQDIGPAGSMVLQFLDHLTDERPVSEAGLERWLLLAQQIPGVSVHAVLQAEADDPGALTLIAEVSKQSVSGLLTADNRGFDESGPAEGLLVGDLNSVTSHGDQTEVSLFHTSGNTDNFGQLSESFFLGSDGLRLRLYGGAGRANPSGSLRQIDYQSFISVFGAQLSYPLVLRRNQALTLTGHFDGIDDRINTGGSLSSSDILRVTRGGGQYAWEDLWAGDSRGALSIFDSQLSYGIPAFGASADGRTAPPAGRADAKIDFWKLNGSISRTQTLFSPAPETTIAVRTELGGQYTSDILPSEEEYYLGGNRFTRGFYSGEVVGDKAAYATAELQLNTGYDFDLLKQDISLGAQFYTFYDWGETWSNLDTDLNHRINSYGGGVRLGLTRTLEFDSEVVRRLTTQLEPVSSGVGPLSDTIFYWGVTARY